MFVIDGLFFLFPDAGKCEHFSGYTADKCAGREFAIGIHDLPIAVYFGVLLGVPALAGVSRGIWVLLFAGEAKNSVGS
ncbi:hypothetical protein HFO88_04555 [Rhizobium leguminosarum]|nr:hypothetical protein [Rhizobium leguminosarum]MBY5905807.1 hypothetical protein [Rhizobium leguminosarum]NKK89729.1 hypothetical protein [Rhizobium leguminosarum bv. viciae]